MTMPTKSTMIAEALDDCRRHFEIGEHEALEEGLEIVGRQHVPMPDWMHAAVTEIVKASWKARPRKSRADREQDAMRARWVLFDYLKKGISFEDAHAATAERLGISAEAVKKSTDRFLRRNPGLTFITGFHVADGVQTPIIPAQRKKRSRRIR